jgi:acyl-CoA synthetase (AMP-forming)/AMP-acid ligase II
MLGAGVKHGDRVAMLSAARPEFLIALLACQRIGAVWFGLSTRDTPDRMSVILAEAKPCLLLVQPIVGKRDFASELSSIANSNANSLPIVWIGTGGAEADSWESFLASESALQHASGNYGDPDAVALIVYTSGSTGEPKGAQLTNRNLLFTSRAAADRWQAKPYRCLCNLPANHIGAIGSICGAALVAGGAIVFSEQFDAAHVPDMVQREALTVLLQVPTMLQLMFDHARFDAAKLSSLQWLLWGGGPIAASLLPRLRSLPVSLGTFYGMSESAGALLFTDADADDEHLLNTIGKPVAGCDVALVDDAGDRVTAGEIGELHLRAPAIMLGYLNWPEATAAAVDADGWLHSGDLAKQWSDGTLELVGRRGEMFKSGGFNVYPREVEQVLEAIPGISVVVVVDKPDPLYHQVGHAFFVLEGDARITVADMEQAAYDGLANYKVPKGFTAVTELPVLTNGKIDRRALREQARATTELS